MFSLSKFNPIFVYRRRKLIRPYVRNYARDAWLAGLFFSYACRARMAEQGLPWSANDRQLARLKNRHRGCKAFVIGNGPSLRVSDLDLLKGEITFASNRVYVAFSETCWRPTYFATSYLDDESGFYDDIDKMGEVMKFLPHPARTHCRPVRSALYYHYIHRLYYPGLPAFSENALECLYWGGTITYILLQLAFYMGIREVYLCGVDADYQFKDDRLHEGRDVRLYATDCDPDHFHKDYLKPGRHVGLTCLHLHLASYIAAKEAFERAGGAIYNATRGGKLDLFARVNLDDVANG